MSDIKGNAFEEIGIWDIEDYQRKSKDDKKNSVVGKMYDKLFEQIKSVKSQEDLDTLISQLSSFALTLDPNEDSHKKFYRTIEDNIVNRLDRLSDNRSNLHPLEESYEKLPAENKVGVWFMTSGYPTYLDKKQIIQESPLTKLPSRYMEYLETAAPQSSEFLEIAPVLVDLKANKNLRQKLNQGFIYYDKHFHNQGDDFLCMKLSPENHNLDTLKFIAGSEKFNQVCKEILNNDSLLRNISNYRSGLPDTLSARYDILAQAGEFPGNEATHHLVNELAYSDINKGNANLLDADKIISLLNEETHIESALQKISPKKLDEVMQYANSKRIWLPNIIENKIQNRKLAESNDINQTLDLANRKINSVPAKSSIKDQIDHLKISSEKLQQIKESPQYAIMQSTLAENAKINEDVNQKATQRDVLNQSQHQLKKFQELAANIAKLGASSKDGQLSATDIESMIAKAAMEKYEPLKHSEAKLPLLFGRKKEKARQEALNSAIDKMNSALAELAKPNKSIYDGNIKKTLLQYSGHLLDNSTLEKVTEDFQEAKRDTDRALQNKQSYEEINKVNSVRSTMEKLGRTETQIAENSKVVNREKDARLNKARQHLKEKLGIDNKAGKSGVVIADQIASKIIESKQNT